MGWTGNWVCTSFRKELLTATHDFSASGGHTFKVALYDANATLNADTTVYSATNEITDSGYTAGGIALTNVEPTSASGVGYCSFENAVFTGLTLSAAGALIYNTSASNAAVIVLDFGGTRTASDFTVTMPTADALNAIIRI